MRDNPILREFLDKGYARGKAIGQPNIRNDTVTFRYKGDRITIRSMDMTDDVKSNGTFFEMPVKKFRELKNGLRGRKK